MAQLIGERVLPAPAPVVLPEVKQFWDATAEGRLMLPRCEDCQTVIWYPRPYCPVCTSLRIPWFEAPDRGSVYSFTINRRGQADLSAYREAGEYVLTSWSSKRVRGW
jgi:uncharacterized OB-fold protein